MTFEADLFTVLRTVADRVFPDFAEVGTQRPYVTFQQVGGPMLQTLSGEALGVRLPEMQINVWADTRKQALALARSIEAALRGATTFHARPLGEPVCDYDADVPVYGTRQDFSCRHTT